MWYLIKINFRDCVIDCKNNNDDIVYNIWHSVHEYVRIKCKLWNPKICNVSLR